MTDAELLLANVLADALAHHEAGDLLSLVIAVEECPVPAGHLDFERAGRIAAAALEPAGTDPEGRALFRARAQDPIEAEAATSSPSSSPDLDGKEPRPQHGAAAAPDPNRVGELWGVVRRVFPTGAARHNFLLSQMRQLGVVDPTLAKLHSLSYSELTRIIDRAELFGQAARRSAETTSTGDL